ncbi:type IA DNA topoisomerase [Bacillus sp. FJAT-50079]|uniref:type IA DNA topoisomerase n=1 Tax=Bacillus sp. FJAT-50079 TaxID=2833577 RepID=UPI001BC9DEB4|nr:type IA DNA topoisomerase [Bacillus sp. FJAT-50079]MBS4210239.1 DNA topoisomerase III [Bacillus sp. FJAT-50079]
MKPVILAEKPSQAKAYADAFSVKARHKTHIELNPCGTFPNGAIITWGIGHLVELKEPKEYRKEWASWNLASLPIMPSRYEYKVSYDKKVQFNFIKQLFNDPSITTILNGCDCDREGSNIFYSIYYMTGAKNKTIKRLWINSLEVDEVRKGFNNLQDNRKDLQLYYEAKTRQISDWLVGMNGSRLYTLLLQQKGFNESLSIGRVQSPTVYLIYQRQKEIENFVSTPFYEIEGNFTAKNGTYKGKVKIKSDKKEEVQQLLEQHHITEQNEGMIKSVTKKEKRTKSPKLHALSTLQAVANKKWKYSPANVLKVVQGLYEKKLVTYPRTDTQFITNNEFAYLANNVERYQQIAGVSFPVASKRPNKRYVDNSKVQEHYAIVPTKSIPTEKKLQGLSIQERNLYIEILKTTLAMFHSDYIYEETKIITDVNGLEFETTGQTEISKGWKELFSDSKREAANRKKEAIQALPMLSKGEKVLGIVKMIEGMTTPPKPYTEGQLIGMMKTCGKVVENEEEMEILKAVEGLGTEATRSGIIETIKKHGYIEVDKNIVSVTKKGEILCQSIEGNLLSSPSMTAKWEAYLRKIGNGEGSSEHFISTIAKFINKLIQEVPSQLKVGALEQNIAAIQKNSVIATCPTCKRGGIVQRKTYYGCTEHANGCKQTFPGKMLGKKLTEKNIKDLCTKGKTSVIKGMKSKAGKKFNASLKFEGDKIQFEFVNKV